MKKRFENIILIVVMAVLVTGCCNHSYIEATCIAPKTCVECGKTEGDTVDHQWSEATCESEKVCIVCNKTEGTTLEHIWSDATCSTPKTCTVCRITEGETLPHNLTEANYQEASKCTVCGEIVGEPLQAEYEECGRMSEEITISDGENIIGKDFEYFAMCAEDKNKTTRGQVLVLDSKRVSADENHPAKEGYEWIILNLTLRYEDENFEYGIYSGLIYDDYYNSTEFEKTVSEIEDEHYWHFTYTVNWQGKDYEECEVFIDSPYSFTDYGCEIYMTVNSCVPIGYDGSILGFYNQQIESIYDDSDAILIRLK